MQPFTLFSNSCRLDLANAQLILKFPLTHSWISLNVQVTSTALNTLRTQSPTFKLWYQELWKFKRTGTDKKASVGSLIKYYQESSEALGLNDSSQTKIARHYSVSHFSLPDIHVSSEFAGYLLEKFIVFVLCQAKDQIRYLFIYL